MSEKIYVGQGKVKEARDGRKWLTLLMSKSDVEELLVHAEDGFVRLDVNKRREPSQKGYTHYLTVNTWKPDNAGGSPDDDNTPF